MFSRIAIFAVLASLHIIGLCSPAQVHDERWGYYNPDLNGGSMLDNARNGLGEPLNVIISGASSSDVLTNEGIVNYARALGFWTDRGPVQSANLGDGHGWVDQVVELRVDEGYHFRVFRQDGPQANSGALFLAVSQDDPVTGKVVPDGYDIGRDALVAAALAEEISYDGVSYAATSRNITGLLMPGSSGGINYGISQDGVVMFLTVTSYHY